MKDELQAICKHSHIEIHNYDEGDCPELERTFAYYNMGYFRLNPLGKYYDADNKIMYIPRGIDLWWLESKLNTKVIMDYDCQPYRYIDDINLKVEPRENQKQALRFMVCAGEYKKNASKSQLSLNLNTGKGKTYISIASIVYYGIATILIMSSNSYIEQWVERIYEYTDLKEKDIKVIRGSAGINSLLKRKKNTHSIYLVTHSTLHSYASTNGWESIDELFTKLGIGIKIYDEAHQNFENICMIDFFTNVYKTFYVTASPAKSSEEENRIYGLYFKNVPAIALFDTENDPHTKYIAIKFNSNPTIYDINACKNNYGFNRNAYIEYLINTKEYYQLLRVIMNLALRCNGKCLIYIGTNKAITTTYMWLSENYPELDGKIGIFTSLLTVEQKEDVKSNKKIILSTTKSAGAAVDIKNLKMTVVLNEPFKSHVITQQTIGRTRDANTFYIDCVDMGFEQCRRYFTYKKPVVEKYCTTREQIILSAAELESRNNAIIKQRGNFDLVSFSKPVELVSWAES